MTPFEEIRQISTQLRLLYVEDDDMVRNATLTILNEYFNSIVIAINGDDGIEKFKENEIDIIITDINMPKKNGLKMTQEIKEIDQNVPILILSAYNETGYFMDSIRYGVEGYLIKPIDLRQFETTLKKTVKNIQMRKENEIYKLDLEAKVAEQLKELIEKDMLISRQAKLAAMGEMIDVIAHQWKQPLNIISMNNHIIDMHKKEDNSIDFKYILKCRRDVKVQIDHLVTTLDEFRNFFRPNYNIETINIKNLFESLKILLKDEFISNTVDFRVNCPDNIYIKVNENDIKHLFINLIKNSIDEMSRLGLEYDQRIIDVDLFLENDTVKIIVEDSAGGIPEDVLPNLFQVNFTTKEEMGGTGVGLYMCKQIVQKYNGEITASNSTKKDRGGSFCVTLPSSNLSKDIPLALCSG